MTKLLRASFAFLVLPALLLAQGTAAPLRIGTWNLEFLGCRKDPPRADDDVQKIGAYVRTLGVAVLAVQEIGGEAPLQELARDIGPQWQCVLGTSGDWGDGKTRQSVGFVFDGSRVELLSAEERLDFPRTLESVPIFHRVPVSACFRDKVTGADFRAVTVHLKAGQTPKDLQKRRLEATTLHDWLRTLQQANGEDQDIVVLGDFNSTADAEPATILQSDAALRYQAPPQPKASILHFQAQIDQIATAPGFAEVRAGSMVVHDDLNGLDRDAWRKSYSDHLPVTIELVADRDDDPQATFAVGAAAQRLPIELRPANGKGNAAATTAPSAGTASSGYAPRDVVGDGSPFAAGTRIHIEFTDGPAIEGVLLAPPGAWILVRDGLGQRSAYPQTRVRVLRELPR